jgi:hypothetical protein
MAKLITLIFITMRVGLFIVFNILFVVGLFFFLKSINYFI